MIRIGPELTDWLDGNDESYFRYLRTTAWGKVIQLERRKFEFRPNSRMDVYNWLIESSHLNGELQLNRSGYLGEISFDDDVSSLEFKLRWC